LGTIVLASAERNRPSPALAANLAIALAQSGERVVLMDGNLRHPKLHALFGAPANAPGLANLLERSSACVDDLLVEGPHPGLRLLLAGTSTKTAGELLAGDQLIRVVAELRRSADAIIMDVPPLVGSTVDALLFTAAADHALLVVDAGRTRPVDLETALAKLGTTGVDVCGVVLAGAEPRYRR
jgi:capsular exopolysaccharide synthesis family protein